MRSFLSVTRQQLQRDLLGGTILYRGKDGAHRYWITETEAYYHDEQDKRGS